MYLINTKTFKLEEFDDGSAPPYAILSHTWGPDFEELTFSDVNTGINDKPGIGSIKFRECCRQAQKDSLRYAWIDTCCIDKTNLVALNEAINSMFRWYSLATVCYVYLSDVHDDDKISVFGSQFRKSRWFERGWTLQELLAPKHLRFYNAKWRYIGTKGSRCSVIQEVTRVPRQFLLGVAELYTASVAQRMSWAAQRTTKRAEDVAYCLLGIFGISMPMIYGEGGKAAFFRLQEQIMKTTRDDSILAWGLSQYSSIDDFSRSIDEDTFIYGDILAAHPSNFQNSGQIITREQATNPLHSLDIFGGSLRVHLPMLLSDTGETFGLLSCGPESDTQQVVAIPLAKINSVAANEYVRPIGFTSVFHSAPTSDASPELIHIKKDGQRNISTKTLKHMFYDEDAFTEFGLNIVDVLPRDCWDDRLALISQLNSYKECVTDRIFIRIRQMNEQFLDYVVIVDFGQPKTPVDLLCCVFSCHKKTKLGEIAEKFLRKTLEAFKQTDASNGSLYLRIKLEPMEGNMISFIPEAMTRPPEYTINATVALENLDIEESIRLLCEKKEKDAEMEELSERVERIKWSLKRIEEQQKAVESQLRECETRKKVLSSQQRRTIDNIWYSERLQEAIRKRQEEIPKQMASTQKRLKEFYHTKGCQDGWTPFRSAMAIGDIDMMDVLFDVTTDIMAEDKRWTRWISASITGDVNEIRLLLATDETELEHKDGIFGRTPLSWASMNGHLDVVKLLLNTDKVNIRSEDNNGQTPLRLALKRGCHVMIRLMLRKDKPVYLRELHDHSDSVKSVAFSHDSKLILSGSSDKTVKLWDDTTSECLCTFQGHAAQVSSVAFSNDSKLVMSGSFDETIKLWNSATGECLHIFRGHSRMVNSVAFSHDSKLILSGSSDTTAKVWDSATSECLHTFKGHTAHVLSVAFSHDSKLVISGSFDEKIKLWDSATGECIDTFIGHNGSIVSVAFSHDSKSVASGSLDKTIRLWDSATGKCLHTLRGHNDSISSVAFSHDSKLVASGSSLCTIKLWASSTGECLYTLQDGYIFGSCPVAFSHDSKLIMAGVKNDILFWDVSVVHEFVTSSPYQEHLAAREKERTRYQRSRQETSRQGIVEWLKRPLKPEDHDVASEKREALRG